MKRTVFLLLILAMTAGAAKAQAVDDQAAVTAVVNKLFAAMAAADPAGIAAVATAENQLVAVFKQKDGTSRVQVIPGDQFAKMFADKTKVMEEIMYAPRAEVNGDWAMVWGRYVFFAGGKLSHCGINQFNLVRTPAGWRIANGASVIDPGACSEAEKAIKPTIAVPVKPAQ